MQHKNIVKFNTTDLIVISMLTVLLVLMEIALAAAGGTLPMVLFVFLADPIFVILVIFLVRKPGAVVIAALLAAILALPTPAFGVPGLTKYLILIPSAGAAEIAFYALRKKERIASAISGGALVAVNSIAFYLTAKLLGLPSLQAGMLETFTVAGFVVGAIGGFLGYKLYKRIENKPFVRNISENDK